MRVLVVDPAHPDPAAIAEAVRVLRAGGLVAFPTETVYGLGARALDPRAVEKVFAAKGRPAGHPLIAHVEGEEGGRAVAASWSARASRLARAFWPGPLTLVVPRAPHVPRVVTGGGDTVAVRAPSHPVARALLAAIAEPLAAPSANPYQTLSPTIAAHVVAGLADKVDLVVDGGACDAGIESTVVDVNAEPPRVLRPGALDMARLRGVLPDVVAVPARVAGVAVRASPGMDARHYAPPRARLRICPTRAAAIDEARAHAPRAGLVVRGAAGELPGVVVRALGDDPVQYARELFAALHELDGAGCAVIVVEAVPADDERWWAVGDRLARAAAAG
jgi:L-threonylcarbamoyladenylate synthase